MAKVLNLDEMLEIIEANEWDGRHYFAALMEATGDAMARLISDKLNVSVGECQRGGSFTCVAFSPFASGDPCPGDLEEFDISGAWEPMR